MNTKDEIKLIAEFMGFIKPTNGRPDCMKVPEGQDLHYKAIHLSFKQMKYTTSWDWLMPVVIKCHELSDAKEKEFPETKDLSDPTGWRAWSIRRVSLSTDIQKVYENVIRFIKWYRSQPEGEHSKMIW